MHTNTISSYALAIIAYHCAEVASRLNGDNEMFWQDEHIQGVSAALPEGLSAQSCADNEPDMCGFEIHDKLGKRGEIFLNLHTGEMVVSSGGEERVVWSAGDHASIHGWEYAGDCDDDDGRAEVIDALNTFPGVGRLVRRVADDVETAYYVDLSVDGAPVLTFAKHQPEGLDGGAHYAMMRRRL
jgi:hypothetical protein